MIFQQVYGFGKIKLTVRGAPGETVAITGKESTSVELDENGDGYIELAKPGDYTFTGSISGYTVTKHLRTGEITADVFPEGFVYWHGRIREGVTTGTDTYTNRSGYDGCSAYFSDEGYFRSRVNNRGTGEYSCTAKSVCYLSGFDKSGYTALYWNVSSFSRYNNEGALYFGQASAVSGSDTTYTNRTSMSSGGIKSQEVVESGNYIALFVERTAIASSTAKREIAASVSEVWFE